MASLRTIEKARRAIKTIKHFNFQLKNSHSIVRNLEETFPSTASSPSSSFLPSICFQSLPTHRNHHTLRKFQINHSSNTQSRFLHLKALRNFHNPNSKFSLIPTSSISSTPKSKDVSNSENASPSISVEEAFKCGNTAAAELKEYYCNEFRKRIIPSHDLPYSVNKFPYYLNELTAQQILDCVRANLNFPELSKFGGNLSSSNRCMLFYGNSGTELYQERLAQAIAKETDANFLFVDEKIMCPLDENHISSDEKKYHHQKNDKQMIYKHNYGKRFIIHFQELDEIDFEEEEEEDDEEEEGEGEEGGDREGEERGRGRGRKRSNKSKFKDVNSLDDETESDKGREEGEGEEGEDEEEDDEEDEESELGENEKMREYEGEEEGGYRGEELCNSDDESEAFMSEYENEVVLVVKRPPSRYQTSGWSSLKPEGRDTPPFFGLKIGDKVRYTGFGSGIASEWRMEVLKNGKHLWIHKDSLSVLWTTQTNDEESRVSENKTKIGTVGKIVAFDSKFPGRFAIEIDEDSIPCKKNEKNDKKYTSSEENSKNGEKESEEENKSLKHDFWDVRELQSVENAEIERGDVCREAFFEILSQQSIEKPLLVFFQNCIHWFDKAVPYNKKKLFFEKLQKNVDDLNKKNIILIGGYVSKQEMDAKASKISFSDSCSQSLGLSSLPFIKMFSNVVDILPPKDSLVLEVFKNALEKDNEFICSRNNTEALKNVLKQNSITCDNLPFLSNSSLDHQIIERIAGIARNIYIGRSKTMPKLDDDDDGKLNIPAYCFEKALEMVCPNNTPSQPSPKEAAGKDEFEKIVASEVISASEIKISFDDVGALDEVKSTLTEISILPLKRPELFSRGNLTKPTKGILLFGPPGTGKTLLAKAIATEAGASFISISSSTLTSKWFGEAEKLTRALFSLAKKISPSIIFIDEVDSLLGARGSSMEHEATRRMRCEFMSAWDGLKSSDNERVQILAATNRPFDLDEAIIRRMPRRIMVPMPDAANRAKIMKVILKKENLVSDFNFDEIAKLTEGYSGSDLKNLCIAAAYRPIREYLEEEKKEREIYGHEKMQFGSGEKNNRETPAVVLRPLTMEDFTCAMVQVGASINQDNQNMMELNKWNEQYGEGGNRKKRTFGFISV